MVPLSVYSFTEANLHSAFTHNSPLSMLVNPETIKVGHIENKQCFIAKSITLYAHLRLEHLRKHYAAL